MVRVRVRVGIRVRVEVGEACHGGVGVEAVAAELGEYGGDAVSAEAQAAPLLGGGQG